MTFSHPLTSSNKWFQHRNQLRLDKAFLIDSTISFLSSVTIGLDTFSKVGMCLAHSIKTFMTFTKLPLMNQKGSRYYRAFAEECVSKS